MCRRRHGEQSVFYLFNIISLLFKQIYEINVRNRLLHSCYIGNKIIALKFITHKITKICVTCVKT